MYNQKVEKAFWTTEDGTSRWTGFPRVSSLISGWIPIWDVEAHHAYLLVLAFKIHTRGRPGGATPNIQEDACGLT